MYNINFELLVIVLLIMISISKHYNIDIKETGNNFDNKQKGKENERI